MYQYKVILKHFNMFFYGVSYGTSSFFPFYFTYKLFCYENKSDFNLCYFHSCSTVNSFNRVRLVGDCK